MGYFSNLRAIVQLDKSYKWKLFIDYSLLLIRSWCISKSLIKTNISTVFLSKKFHIIHLPVFIYLVEEIFIYEVYACKEEVKEIVDIGGNIGLSTYYFHLNYQGVMIYVYEPDDLNFECLSKNFPEPDFPHIHLYCEAVSELGGNVSFSSYGFGLNSKIESNGERQVKAVALHEVVNEKSDLVKIDIEGGEVDVLISLFRRSDIRPFLIMVETEKENQLLSDLFTQNGYQTLGKPNSFYKSHPEEVLIKKRV